MHVLSMLNGKKELTLPQLLHVPFCFVNTVEDELCLCPPMERNGNPYSYIGKKRSYISYKYIDFVPRNCFSSSTQSSFFSSTERMMVFLFCFLSVLLAPFLSLISVHFSFPCIKNPTFSPPLHTVSLFINLTSVIHKPEKLTTTDGCALASEIREGLPGLTLQGSFLMNFVAYGFYAVLFFHCCNKCFSVRGICH